MEGHGDLVSRLIIRIARVTIWVRGIGYLLSPPDPSSRVSSFRFNVPQTLEQTKKCSNQTPTKVRSRVGTPLPQIIEAMHLKQI